MKSNVYKYREEWLSEAVSLLEPSLGVADLNMPEKWQVTCGPTGKALGCCYKAKSARDQATRHIVIGMHYEDPYEVLATLTHEMIHAALPDGVGHRYQFKEAAETIGLEGPAKATTVGKDTPLGIRLQEIMEELGPYPHVSLIPVIKEKPKRVTWGSLSDHEFQLVISQRIVDEKGPPKGPDGKDLVKFVDGKPEQGSEDDEDSGDEE